MTLHLFPDGQVERGCPKTKIIKGRGRITVPGYRWVPGYTQAVRPGVTCGPFTRLEWWDMAARDGDKCKFHETREEAFANCNFQYQEV